MQSKIDLQWVYQETSDMLTIFVQQHDEIFKKKGIFGIFKKINFNEVYTNLQFISDNIEQTTPTLITLQKLNDYKEDATIFLEYNRAFLDSICSLEKIAESLYLVSENQLKLNPRDYNELVSQYELSEQHRLQIGSKLNSVTQNIWG